MGWRLTTDVEEYAARVLPLLRTDPVGCTVALSVLGQLRAGLRFSDDPLVLCWLERDGEVVGAASASPPYPLVLDAVPATAAPALVDALRAAGAVVPGCNGEGAALDAFVAAWTARTGARAEVTMAQLLYVLGDLAVPDVAGAGRPAGPADLALCTRWWEDFAREAGVAAPGSQEHLVRDRMADDRLWLWEVDGTPVALAGRNRVEAGVARVGPVWTPPEHRRRGYGGAVTAAVTADALARGATGVVLFTDVANPTSNGVYRRLGFRPVGERRVVDFR